MLSNNNSTKIVSSKEIGQAVKRRRTALGMSQEKLAELLNVTYQQVQRYENGRNKLNVENIQTVAAALDVTASFFFNPDNVIAADPEFPYACKEEQELCRLLRIIKADHYRSLLIDVARLVTRL